MIRSAIIVINYRNSVLTAQFVENELSKLTEQFYVVIVNNQADDESNDYMKIHLHATLISDDSYVANPYNRYIIPSATNLGFAKANNLAVDFVSKYLNADYLLFTNNDISIKEPNTIQCLIRKLEENQVIGMIGPQVRGTNGDYQTPFPYKPFWDTYVRMYAYTPFLTPRKKAKRFMLDYPQCAKEGYHYRIMGSFFMMRAVDYKAIGGMDSNTFLYAEEMILAERLKAIGKKVYYYPNVSVIHQHGATTKQTMTKGSIRNEKLRSELYYYHHYMHEPMWKLMLGQTLYKLMMLLKRLE